MDNTKRPGRWLPWEVLLLIGLVVSVYFTMITALPVRGEETRWAREAAEMIESGDWIVPHQQGQVFLDRPPLGSWTMALVGSVRGRIDLLAIRLPSVLAILATTLLIYGYSRQALSRLGAFTAAVTYPSFALVLQIGWTGENEAVYTLLFSAALLLWHRGYLSRWPAALTWSVGYGFAALAMLVKGPQAPAYFLAVTTVYTLLRREPRRLLSVAHLAGIGTFLLVVGLWLVPFYLRTNWHSTIAILTQTSAIRYGFDSLATHMALYPIEVWAGFLPGAVVLVGLAYPRILRQLGQAPAVVRFALTAVLVTFPTVWLAQAARPRYFMPLSACVAVIVGWTIERLVAARPGSAARFWWRFCMAGAAAGVIGFVVVLVVAGATHNDHLEAIAPSLPLSFVYGLAFLAIAGVLIWAATKVGTHSTWAAVTALAIFQGLLFRGILTTAVSRTANDMSGVVAELRQSMPEGTHLVSFGRAHHRFAYYYQTLIPELPWPGSQADVPADVTWFCFDPRGAGVPADVAADADSLTLPNDGILPFEWEQIAHLNTARSLEGPTDELTIVGRIVRPR